MPESLLQKALKKESRTGGKSTITKDEIELLEAVLDGRVSVSQAKDALEYRAVGGVYTWAMKVLTALRREGRLTIHDTPGK